MDNLTISEEAMDEIINDSIANFKKYQNKKIQTQRNFLQWLDVFLTKNIICDSEDSYLLKEFPSVNKQEMDSTVLSILSIYDLNLMEPCNAVYNTAFGKETNFSYKGKVFYASFMIGQGSIYMFGIDTNPEHSAPDIEVVAKSYKTLLQSENTK